MEVVKVPPLPKRLLRGMHRQEQSLQDVRRSPWWFLQWKERVRRGRITRRVAPPAGVVSLKLLQERAYVSFRDEVLRCLRERTLKHDFDHAPLTFLLIGETGSGKSALVTLLVNFLRASSVRQLEHVIHQDTENQGSTAESSTLSVVIYKLRCGYGGPEIRLIDTPGFNDTRSVTQDGHNRQMVVDSMHSLSSIHGVLIVANGTATRLTASQKYVLAQVAMIVPQQAHENIFVVATRCATRRKVDLPFREIAGLLGREIGGDRVVPIENPIAEWRKILAEGEQPTDADFGDLDKTFRNAAEELLQLFVATSSLKPTPTLQFQKLDACRSEVERALSNHLYEVGQHHTRQTSLQQLEDQHKRGTIDHQAVANAWQNVNEREVQQHRQVDHHNTLCHNPDCRYKFCHERCSLSYTPVEDPIFSGCWANDQGVCQTCGCGNFGSCHWHGRYEIHYETVRSDDLKIKARSEKSLFKLGSIETQLGEMKVEVGKLEMRVQRSLKNLQKWLLAFNRSAALGSYRKFLDARVAFALQYWEQQRDKEVEKYSCPLCGWKPERDPQRTVMIRLMACQQHAVCKVCAEKKETHRCVQCDLPRDRSMEKDVNLEFLFEQSAEAKFISQLVKLLKSSGTILEKVSAEESRDGVEAQRDEAQENEAQEHEAQEHEQAAPRELVQEPACVDLGNVLSAVEEEVAAADEAGEEVVAAADEAGEEVVAAADEAGKGEVPAAEVPRRRGQKRTRGGGGRGVARRRLQT